MKPMTGIRTRGYANTATISMALSTNRTASQNAKPSDSGAEEQSFFVRALQADGRYGGNKRGDA